ncbi:hypothetical protein PHMEG_00019887 [Phytophthora megakarya]|uniref:Retroviral polymerase SH3-like domain-containing protein n=1 Tax=Phytophthora megakarya TaxID=4795 RepID=A0A225VSD3_9STRA|nr:hypothetical protein PHMEG_00019887 [Phytophthora megakarya]
MAAKWWPEALLYIRSEYGVQHVMRMFPKPKEMMQKCKLLGISSKYKGYRLLGVKANKYLIARDVKFSTTVSDAMIRRSFPIENYFNDLEEERVIQKLGKRSRGNIVEVPTQGEDMSSESAIRSPTS